mmetsp:Transcript_25177/g.95141  ORF Transcript_25177/g.95141 Transcript_25177/m.95141 type:complete len:293 (+) Transcript_25177:10-888(+)
MTSACPRSRHTARAGRRSCFGSSRRTACVRAPATAGSWRARFGASRLRLWWTRLAAAWPTPRRRLRPVRQGTWPAPRSPGCFARRWCCRRRSRTLRRWRRPWRRWRPLAPLARPLSLRPSGARPSRPARPRLQLWRRPRRTRRCPSPRPGCSPAQSPTPCPSRAGCVWAPRRPPCLWQGLARTRWLGWRPRCWSRQLRRPRPEARPGLASSRRRPQQPPLPWQRAPSSRAASASRTPPHWPSWQLGTWPRRWVCAAGAASEATLPPLAAPTLTAPRYRQKGRLAPRFRCASA